MKKINMKMNDAYNFVREKRPIIAPNLVFMSQLMDYEKQLNDNKSNDDFFSISKNSKSSYLQEPDYYMDHS
jgi:hypothetical protein